MCLCKAHTASFQTKVSQDKAPSVSCAPDRAQSCPSGAVGVSGNPWAQALWALSLISALPSGQMFSIGQLNEESHTSKQGKRKYGAQSKVVTKPLIWFLGKRRGGEQSGGPWGLHG